MAFFFSVTVPPFDNLVEYKLFSEWLLLLEDQGIRVFPEDVLRLHAKAEFYRSGVNRALPSLNPADENTYSLENGVYVGNKVFGDQEMVLLPASACLMNQTNSHGRRKREEEMTEEASRNKIVKLNSYENSVTEKFMPVFVNDALMSGNGVSAAIHGNEMETTSHSNSDEDMENVG